MSDLTIFSDDSTKPEWKLRVNETDSELADIRTYHLNSYGETRDLAAGILADCPQTDLTIFYNESPQVTNPFSLYDDIDDMPHPLAAGQLLGALSGSVEPDVLWALTHADFDAVELIGDEATRAKADRIMNRLSGIKAWDDDLDDTLDDLDNGLDDLGSSTEFEYCDRCGFDTLHNLNFSSLSEYWTCSICGAPNAAVYGI